MKLFVFELRLALGLPTLSRQTLYEWESARARVPASALIAAARLCGLTVDELMRRSARAAAILSTPG
jgi:transcriptional regulator with XRE-family HTH domain